MNEKKYYFCNKCGNLVQGDKGVSDECCGKRMNQIFGGVDGNPSKHTPIVSITNGKLVVDVGKEGHPMEKDHLIEWVYLKTDRGRYIKYLDVNENPSVTFPITNETPLEVSAFCNKHGLWHAEM